MVIRGHVASVAWLNFVWVLAQASGDKFWDGRREVVPDRGYGRDGFPGLGSGKCQMGEGTIRVRGVNDNDKALRKGRRRTEWSGRRPTWSVPADTFQVG